MVGLVDDCPGGGRVSTTDRQEYHGVPVFPGLQSVRGSPKMNRTAKLVATTSARTPKTTMWTLPTLLFNGTTADCNYIHAPGLFGGPRISTGGALPSWLGPWDFLRIQPVIVPYHCDHEKTQSKQPVRRGLDREDVAGRDRRNEDDREERRPNNPADPGASGIVSSPLDDFRDHDERDEDRDEHRGDHARGRPDLHDGLA